MYFFIGVIQNSVKEQNVTIPCNVRGRTDSAWAIHRIATPYWCSCMQCFPVPFSLSTIMEFQNANYIDARYGTFYNVGNMTHVNCECLFSNIWVMLRFTSETSPAGVDDTLQRVEPSYSHPRHQACCSSQYRCSMWRSFANRLKHSVPILNSAFANISKIIAAVDVCYGCVIEPDHLKPCIRSSKTWRSRAWSILERPTIMLFTMLLTLKDNPEKLSSDMKANIEAFEKCVSQKLSLNETFPEQWTD